VCSWSDGGCGAVGLCADRYRRSVHLLQATSKVTARFYCATHISSKKETGVPYHMRSVGEVLISLS